MLFLEHRRLVLTIAGKNYEPKWPTSVYPVYPTNVIMPNDLVVL